MWDIVSDTLALVSFYKIQSADKFFFDDGFKFQWRNGDVSDPATGQKCTVITGPSAYGNPSRANVTTLVYAYAWPAA